MICGDTAWEFCYSFNKTTRSTGASGALKREEQVPIPSDSPVYSHAGDNYVSGLSKVNSIRSIQFKGQFNSTQTRRFNHGDNNKTRKSFVRIRIYTDTGERKRQNISVNQEKPPARYLMRLKNRVR